MCMMGGDDYDGGRWRDGGVKDAEEERYKAKGKQTTKRKETK